MFAFLEGTIAYKQDNIVVINVGGVGYELLVSNATQYSLPAINENAKVLTYLQVKEDGVCLYGFATQEEKDLFLKLISVSGVGPKGAIGILSNISITDLVKAIALNDIKVLSSIKGIGKKTAERIGIELKDKVAFDQAIMQQDTPQVLDSKAIDEACLVLISLGVSKNEALSLARQYAKEDSTAEEIVSKALRGLGN